MSILWAAQHDDITKSATPNTPSLGETGRCTYLLLRFKGEKNLLFFYISTFKPPKTFFLQFSHISIPVSLYTNSKSHRMRWKKAHARVRLLLVFAQGHTCLREACGFVLKLSILVSACWWLRDWAAQQFLLTLTETSTQLASYQEVFSSLLSLILTSYRQKTKMQKQNDVFDLSTWGDV